MKSLIKTYLSPLHADIVDGVYDLGDGETLLTFDYDREREFCCPLTGLGWKSVKRFSLGNTDGTFYTHADGRTVYVYTNTGVPFGHAVLGARLPADDSSVGEPIYNDTVFYQAYNDPTMSGCMTYLIRMKDGRFVIIDGGFHLDGAGLLRIMEQLHPHIGENERFTVAAWLLTHPHDDHIELLKRLLADDAIMARLDIKNMYANCPAESALGGVDEQVIPDNNWMRHVCFEALRSRGGVISKPYAGMSFSVGELCIKVYYTQAEWRYVEMKTVNDASVVMEISRAGGKKVLILGDIMNRAAVHIMKMYTPEQLHAEVVQVAHHAHVGPDINFYRAIDPKVCFWPISINVLSCTEPPSISIRNDKMRETDVLNLLSCFGPAQIVI